MLHTVIAQTQGRRRTKPARSEQRLPVVYGGMTRAAEGIAVE